MIDLTKKQLSALEKLLLDRRVELEKLIEDAEEGSQPVSLDQPIGRLSRMDALQQQSMSQASQQVARQRLEQVKAALHRMAADEYGLCLECEDEIEYARLQARPEAPFCLDCQSAREKRG